MGNVDLRMPNNGMDNVITKAKGGFNIIPFERKIRDKDGVEVGSETHYELEWVSSAPRESGPVKKMNFTDADRVQDADHDWDKTSSYTAVHGRMLKNVAGMAGHEQMGTQIKKELIDNVIQQIIPNIDLSNPQAMRDISSDLRDVNQFRGRIVKAHQIATYLSNSFGQFEQAQGGILGSFMIDKNNQANVVLRNGEQLTNNVEFIRHVVKEYLDYYNNYDKTIGKQQGVSGKEQIKEQQLLEHLFFGPNGMFKMVDRNGNEVNNFNDPAESVYRPLKDAIWGNILYPLSRYIGLNKGDMMAGDGTTQRLSFNDFTQGYQGFLLKLKYPDSYNKDRRMSQFGDFTTFSGRTRIGEFVGSISQAPFDVAMREMHRIYNQDFQAKIGSKSIVSEILAVSEKMDFNLAI